MMEPLILREEPDGRWSLYSATGEYMAAVPDYYAFMEGWMASDARRIEVQP